LRPGLGFLTKQGAWAWACAGLGRRGRARGLGRRGRARGSGGVGVRGSREAWACAGLGRRERARGLRNDAVGEVRLLSPRVPPHADTAHARRLTPTRARKRKRTAKNSAVLSTLAKQEGHCLSETLSRETRSEPAAGRQSKASCSRGGTILVMT